MSKKVVICALGAIVITLSIAGYIIHSNKNDNINQGTVEYISQLQDKSNDESSTQADETSKIEAEDSSVDETHQEATTEAAEPVVDSERKAVNALPAEIENSAAFKNYCNSEYYLPRELFVITDANGYYEFSAQGDGFDISGVCVDGKCSIFVLDPDDLNNAFAEFVDQ